jgi:DNA-binding response OmpR family regulator
MKVLLIINDPEIHKVVSLSFQMGWPEAQMASTDQGCQGLEMVRRTLPDMVLMDLSLPDLDGFELLSRMREFSDVPVIIVTSKDAEIDRIRGLELGADDYVISPFSYMELLARVRAVLRRSVAKDPALPATVENGGLVINTRSEQVKLDGAEVQLTPIEYKLLRELASSTGQTVSQELLLAKVWGEEYLDTPNVLKVHIHRLRRKLGDDPENPRIIATVARRGYQLLAPATVGRPGS